MNKWIVMGLGSLVVAGCLWTGALYSPAMAQEDDGILDRIKRRFAGEDAASATSTARDPVEAEPASAEEAAEEQSLTEIINRRYARRSGTVADEDDDTMAAYEVEEEEVVEGFDEPGIPRGMRDARLEALHRVMKLRRQLANRQGNRGPVMKSLRKASEEYFAADLEFRREELEAVREQLEEMERQLDRRAKSKRRIIDLQMTVWQHEAEGLGLFSPEDQIGPMHHDHGMDMHDMMEDEYGISGRDHGPGESDMDAYFEEDNPYGGDLDDADSGEYEEGSIEDYEDNLSVESEQKSALDRLHELHRRGYLSRQELNRILRRITDTPQPEDPGSSEVPGLDGPVENPNQNIIQPIDPDQNVIVPTEPDVDAAILEAIEELPPPVTEVDEINEESTAADSPPLSDDLDLSDPVDDSE